MDGTRKGRWLGAVGSILVLLTLGALPAGGQTPPAPVEEWRHTVANHDGIMMDIDADDNVFVVGSSVVGDTVPTRKYNADGDLLWERPYPTADERARASWLAADLAGNVVVSAYLIVGNFNPAGWVVYKYDAAGNLLWKDVISVPFGRTVRVETDAAGNAYVVGRMGLLNAFGSLTIDTVVIKYAPNGTRLWTRAFDGGGANTADEPYSLAVSQDGTRVAAVGSSGLQFFAVIYDSQGNEVGRNIQPELGTAWDAAFGPGNVLYATASRWTIETSDQLAVVKLNSSANLLWNRFFSQGVFGYRVAVDSAGDVVVAGVESPIETFFLDWVTLKLAPDGTLRWSQSYSGEPFTHDERPWALDLDAAGGIYVTGDGGPFIRQGGTDYLQLVTVKYTPSGSVEWVALSGNGRGISVRVANAGDAVFVQSLYEMLTLRLSNTDTPPPPPTVIAPSALRVTRTTRTEVRLAWTNQDPDQTAVGVERCRGAGCTNFAEIARVSGTTSSYRDGGRSPNTTYRYRVRGFESDQASPYSNIVNARTRR